jgi:hypothetical protein
MKVDAVEPKYASTGGDLASRLEKAISEDKARIVKAVALEPVVPAVRPAQAGFPDETTEKGRIVRTVV